MRPSRGMGCIAKDKMPGAKPRVIKRKDDPNKVDVYKEGGKVKLPGLYENINAKRKRIAAGSGEKMRKVGSEGAPSKMDFMKSARTAKGK
jgi:hypothetical protein